MKKLIVTTAALFALVCAGWAGGGWGANDNPGGAYTVCHIYANPPGLYSWNGSSWVYTGVGC